MQKMQGLISFVWKFTYMRHFTTTITTQKKKEHAALVREREKLVISGVEGMGGRKRL
jgi:hypothetical protein